MPRRVFRPTLRATDASTTTRRRHGREPHLPRAVRLGARGVPMERKETIDVSCISAHDPQLVRLADAIAERVGQHRFHVWFNNSTRLDLKQDGLEIAVPNDFISEGIGTHFTKPIQEAAHEVLGCPLAVRFNVMPQLFEVDGAAKVDAPTPGDLARAKAPRGVTGTAAAFVGATVPPKAVMQARPSNGQTGHAT